MNNSIERFSYFKNVTINEPMMTYRVYKKYWEDNQCWLGTIGVSVLVPMYAHTVKFLSDVEVSGQSGHVPFLRTVYGEYLQMPKKIEEGRIFKIRNIRDIVIVNEKDFNKIDKRNEKIEEDPALLHELNVMPLNQSHEIECLDLGMDHGSICATKTDASEFYFTGKAIWYADMTDLELKEKGSNIVSEYEAKRNVLNQQICDAIDVAAIEFMGEIGILDSVRSKNVNESKIKDVCKKVQDAVISKFEEWDETVENSSPIVLYEQMSGFNKMEMLCKTLIKKVSDKILDNSNYWTQTAKEGALQIFKNVITGYFFK